MSTTYFTATPEQSLRARCKATWEAGDFGIVAKYNDPAAVELWCDCRCGPVSMSSMLRVGPETSR
jgi:hypothetical protein